MPLKQCWTDKLLDFSRGFFCAGTYESLGPCQAVTIYRKFQLKCYICHCQTRYLSRQTAYTCGVTKIPLRIRLSVGFIKKYSLISLHSIGNAILLNHKVAYGVLRSQLGYQFNHQVTLMFHRSWEIKSSISNLLESELNKSGYSVKQGAVLEQDPSLKNKQTNQNINQNSSFLIRSQKHQIKKEDSYCSPTLLVHFTVQCKKRHKGRFVKNIN